MLKTIKTIQLHVIPNLSAFVSINVVRVIPTSLGRWISVVHTWMGTECQSSESGSSQGGHYCTWFLTAPVDQIFKNL